jgi:hypothetical protein
MVKRPKKSGLNAKPKQNEPISLKQAFQVGNVLVLLFKNPASLACLSRVHLFYEEKLNGPLKGINLPISCWNQWSSMNTLTVDEEFIQSLISEATEYIIACIRGDTSTLLHEWAHMKYHLDPHYKQICNQMWDELDSAPKKAITNDLILRNYKPEVYIDEFQAYLLETPSDFGRKWSDYLYPFHKSLKGLVKLPDLKNLTNLIVEPTNEVLPAILENATKSP